MNIKEFYAWLAELVERIAIQDIRPFCYFHEDSATLEWSIPVRMSTGVMMSARMSARIYYEDRSGYVIGRYEDTSESALDDIDVDADGDWENILVGAVCTVLSQV